MSDITFRSGQYVAYQGGIVRFIKYGKTKQAAVIEFYLPIFRRTAWKRCKTSSLSPIPLTVLENLTNRLKVDLEMMRLEAVSRE